MSMPEVDAKDDAATPAAQIPNRAVLVADDGDDNRRLTEFFLQRAGYEVHMARDGQEALEKVHERHRAGETFAVILMDMQMPRIDGYTATRRLRKQGFRGPIIALTASNAPGDKGECYQAGCDDFVPKPFEFQKLVELVDQHANATS